MPDKLPRPARSNGLAEGEVSLLVKRTLQKSEWLPGVDSGHVAGSNLSITAEQNTISTFNDLGFLMLQALTANNKLVGYYRSALKLVEFLWFIPIALQTRFVHLTSELWSNDHSEKITEIAAQTTQCTFLLTGRLALGLIVLAWLIDIQPRVFGIYLLLSVVIVPLPGLAVLALFYITTGALESDEVIGCSYHSPTRSVHRPKRFERKYKVTQ
ncbi:hypothetical protein A4G99_16305 [Haladaptatus sp. R4]|uniref:hypothetical protein n=1 Tax=Haladaptatus sp. R4 TaxID=1679489 RepID=UPI0007B4E387|nr:hypothetical protein [Haladaptatus sp. R4]KZN23072.1 hypothetical protein A4G99_16305 [Haladaptatus sp. R4]